MNCKPGDLAIIVRARLTPEILGHIVEVVGPWNGYKLSKASVGFSWECRYPDGRPIKRVFDGGRWFSYGESRPIGDQYLRPIRPGDLHETEDERKEVTA